MLRVLNLFGMLTARLSHPGQDVFWISDEDDLFVNDNKTRDTKRLLDSFSSFYIRHPLGQVGVGTTRIDSGDLFDEDCASVADLVAGSSSDIMTKMLNEYGCIPNTPVIVPPTAAWKSDLISKWLFCQRTTLVKSAAMVSYVEKGCYRIGTWFTSDALVETPGDIIVIPQTDRNR